jgi:hypothetical protein
MRRFGESYYHLHKALMQEGNEINVTTILAWLKGTKVPRSLDSMAVLGSIETRYNLQTHGTFVVQGGPPRQFAAAPNIATAKYDVLPQRKEAAEIGDLLPFNYSKTNAQ